jgi:hypothetical protein
MIYNWVYERAYCLDMKSDDVRFALLPVFLRVRGKVRKESLWDTLTYISTRPLLTE